MIKKLIGVLIISLLVYRYAHADRFSYVYIQGDKRIPFYVKLGDDMLPRYSKNYCIIPRLAPGPIHLQILFQQNQYPPQDFIVQVPQAGHRGFLLIKNDQGFALFDIQQQFYLTPGMQSEDRLPETTRQNPSILSNETTAEQDDEMPSQNRTAENAMAHTPVPPAYQPESTAATPSSPQTNQLDFLEDIELNNERKPISPTENEPEQQFSESTEIPATENEPDPYEEIIASQREEKNNASFDNTNEPDMHDVEAEMNEPEPNLTHNAPPIINSDCPEPMSLKEFDEIFIDTRKRNSDDKRISYLMKVAEEECFTTRHSFLLARQLKAEAMRYSFLKKVYPRVTDQQNFHLLGDELFNTVEWKSYFNLIHEE